MKSSRHFDVIVAGVGSMGAAACYHLARRGHSVLGLEQFDIPHNRGSHHGQTRMIRQAYYEHPDYVPLLRQAYENWETLQADCGYEIFFQTGGLYLGSPGATILEGSLAAAREHDLPHEQLSHSSLRDRFPQFKVPEDFTGFYEERAGMLIPELAICAHAEQALRHGAELRAREPILDWESSPSGVRVKTTKKHYEADHLVFTAGAWTCKLVRTLEIELKTTRQVLAWFQPKNPDAFSLGQFPCWFIETDSPYGHYGFPILPGRPGTKIALHKPGVPIEPDQIHRDPGPIDPELAGLEQILHEFLPDAEGPLLSAAVCLYTNTPDHHFIVDRHPEHGSTTIATGFSGHGFKFASVIGQILADLAVEGRTDLPASFLGLSRFE